MYKMENYASADCKVLSCVLYFTKEICLNKVKNVAHKEVFFVTAGCGQSFFHLPKISYPLRS